MQCAFCVMSCLTETKQTSLCLTLTGTLITGTRSQSHGIPAKEQSTVLFKSCIEIKKSYDSNSEAGQHPNLLW